MPRILHFGVGNFHRAHQAWYTAQAGQDWRITGVVMRNQSLFDALEAERGYSLGIRGQAGLETSWIAVHDRLILASKDASAVLEALTDPEVQVVTLTITEKGYALSGQDGSTLDLDNAAIRADLALVPPALPASALGLLTQGLARRFEQGGSPLSVISCDNIADNGKKLGAAVAAFAQAAGLRTDPGNAFPNTMVDRITPATTAAIEAEIQAATGRKAGQPVLTEAFTEWVLEDAFAGPRPAWEQAGATFVEDVAPFEMRKLRLLNAAHSYLAYAGLLKGLTYVHEAIAEPDLRAGVEGLWDEACATLPAVVMPSTPAYRAALIERFSVAAMRHPLAQIAMDGSLKLRERIVPLIEAEGPSPVATKALASWIAFARKTKASGALLIDPKAEVIAARLDQHADDRGQCRSMADLLGLAQASDAWIEGLCQGLSLIEAEARREGRPDPSRG